MPTSCWVYKRAIEIKNMKSLLWMHNFRNEHRDRARACFKEWSHDPMDGDRRRSLHRSGGPSPGVPLQVAQGCRHWDGRISDDAVWLRWPPKWVRKVKRSSEAVAMDDYESEQVAGSAQPALPALTLTYLYSYLLGVTLICALPPNLASSSAERLQEYHWSHYKLIGLASEVNKSSMRG